MCTKAWQIPQWIAELSNCSANYNPVAWPGLLRLWVVICLTWPGWLFVFNDAWSSAWLAGWTVTRPWLGFSSPTVANAFKWVYDGCVRCMVVTFSIPYQMDKSSSSNSLCRLGKCRQFKINCQHSKKKKKNIHFLIQTFVSEDKFLLIFGFCDQNLVAGIVAFSLERKLL